MKKKPLFVLFTAWMLSLGAAEWNFEKGVPEDCTLRGAAELREGGLAVKAGWSKDQAAGCLIKEKVALPEAFELEAVFTPDSSEEGGGILYDDMYVNYPPKCTNQGLQLLLSRAGEMWTPRLYLGYGDETLNIPGASVKLPNGVRAVLTVTLLGDRRARFALGGQTNVIVLAKSGPLAPSVRKPVIGDRVGSNYSPFTGILHSVKILPCARTPFGAAIRGRTAFERGETNAVLAVSIENYLDETLTDVRLELADAVRSVERIEGRSAICRTIPVETRHAPGRYAFTGRLTARRASGEVETRPVALDYSIGPRFGDRMPTVMWHYNKASCADVSGLGFTHATDGFGFGELPATAGVENRAVKLLDEAIGAGLRLVKHVKVAYPQGEDPAQFYRRTRTGALSVKPKAKPAPEVANPKLLDYGRRLAQCNAETFGPHPAFGGVLPVSENRDHAFPSFNTEADRYKAETGREVPAEVYARTYTLEEARKRYPDGVVPEDDPLLAYYRWYWDGGDGWPNYVSVIAEEYRKVMGRYGADDPRQKAHPFFSFWDPSVRCPPRWGSGGSNDVLNQWVYAVPEPMTVAGPCEELFAMAAGRPNQDVMIMTQLICYRSQLAPTNAVVTPEPEWAKRYPQANFPTIPPDSLQEATWSMIAKPVKGIMYHGWGTIFETGETKGYCFTNPKSAERLRCLLREIVTPLGPTLKDLGRETPPVAVLESATTCFMGGPASWGWKAPAITFLQRARLDPRVIYEQTILRDGLDDVKILYAPQCAFLTPSVIAKIAAFQKAGGILVADEQLTRALKPDVCVPVVSFDAPPELDDVASVNAQADTLGGDAKRRQTTMRAKATMLKQAGDLRAALAAKGYVPRLDSSSAEIVTYARRWGTTDYAFAINDHRTFGDYVGAWGTTMEKGLPFAGNLTLADPTERVKAVYELSRGGEVSFSREAGKVVVPLDYQTNDGRFFVYLDEKIVRLEVACDESVAAGGKLRVKLQVVGESGRPVRAILPVEIRLLDAQGCEIDGAGPAAAKDGVAEVEFLTNLDDAAGDYTLVCTDRASGLSLKRPVRPR